MEQEAIEKVLLAIIVPKMQSILNYEFKNPYLLLEALTHKSFKDAFKLRAHYDKLEILGDAILDYLANANLVKYTLFQKYNLQERIN